MNNSFYNDFAVRFAACTLTSLVETFNGQVGKCGFNCNMSSNRYCRLLLVLSAGR